MQFLSSGILPVRHPYKQSYIIILRKLLFPIFMRTSFASFLQPPSSPFGNGDLVDAALQSLCFAVFSQRLRVLDGELLLFI